MSRVIALVLSYALSLACGGADARPTPAVPAPRHEPPAAPDARAESCEAELHVCGPAWVGCVHVLEAGTTPDGRPRFEGDDGAFYETRRDCGADGLCTDHCPGGVCRPGVARTPDAPMACSFLSGPPAPAPFTCVLEAHACRQIPAPTMVPTTS